MEASTLAGSPIAAAASPRKPSAARRLLVAPFQAGLLGAGVFLWLIGILITLYEADFLSMSSAARDRGAVLAALFATMLALARGYTTPLRSYPALAGRLAGGLAAGLAILLAVVTTLESARHSLRSDDRPVAVACAGALVTALAIAWLHGRRLLASLRASRSARWKAAAVASALLLATAWPSSPRLRCALGSGEGCRLASSRAGDEAGALALAERGCALDDAPSCQIAGVRLLRGLRTATIFGRDRGHAEALFRTGCALGDDASCGRLRVLVLEMRCERYSASACRELSRAYRTGTDVEASSASATKLQRQACLLGDAEACRGEP